MIFFHFKIKVLHAWTHLGKKKFRTSQHAEEELNLAWHPNTEIPLVGGRVSCAVWYDYVQYIMYSGHLDARSSENTPSEFCGVVYHLTWIIAIFHKCICRLAMSKWWLLCWSSLSTYKCASWEGEGFAGMMEIPYRPCRKHNRF